MSVALLFPGQGAQIVGMGKDLAQISSCCAERYAEASSLLGYDLSSMCWNGPAEVLHRTQHSQPALYVHSYAALEHFCSERQDLWDSVSAVAGLSLGEYTAVAVAGGLEFEDGLRLVRARGLAMQAASEATQSGMSSLLGLTSDQVEDLCRQATVDEKSFVQPANFLCPGNIAVSGHWDALDRVEKLAMEAGAMRAMRLAVAGAFHTSLMQPAVASLMQALEMASFRPTRVPVYSNVDAQPHSDPEDFKRLLPLQLVAPVQWEQTIRELLNRGIERFIEIGTGRVLAGTIKRINRKIPCENYADSL